LSEIVGQQERRLSLESSEESSSVKTSGAQNEVVAGGSLPRRDSDVFNRYREPKQHTDEIFLDSEVFFLFFFSTFFIEKHEKIGKNQFRIKTIQNLYFNADYRLNY
jgi:hypothetical protein